MMVITVLTAADVRPVQKRLAGLGLWVASVSEADDGSSVLTVAASSAKVDSASIAAIPGVSRVYAPRSAHPRADAHGLGWRVGTDVFSPGNPVLIAGPCAVESPEQIDRIAGILSTQGVRYLRGGAYKPRTSPYSFQGHGGEALDWLRRAADARQMRVVTEVMGEGDVETVASRSDVLQIGSRNMQNFSLLKHVGRAARPVLLKRSMSATVEEWLLAAEYVLAHGAPSVALCERGIRGFDDSTRNLLDLGSVALLTHVHRIPVVVDPSHATGRRDLIEPLARAALAAGASGLMVEMHDDPAQAASDGPQALPPASAGRFVQMIQSAASAVRSG